MNDKKIIYKRDCEVDKEAFANLLLAAKGSRTMKDFAAECKVNPSTFTRIIHKANKGASSVELIEAIAAHATPGSGVTIEKLAQANGYSIEKDNGIKALRLSSQGENAENLVRTILVQELIDRGECVRMGSIRYNFSKSLSLSPDALIMTDAFGKKDGIWFIELILFSPQVTTDSKRIFNKTRVKQMAFDRFARFEFISMNPVELFKPSRFSLVVLEREVFDIIVEEFEDTVVSTDISVILIDTLNNCIADEFMLPHIDKGHFDSYFMTTPKLPKEYDEIIADDESY